MDRWQTFKTTIGGGLNVSTDQLSLASMAPGAATALVNYEVSQYGGYRRVNGYTKYSSTAVTGSGKVYGVAVYSAGVIAARVNSGNIEYYYSTGTTWTKINSDTRGITGLEKARCAKYRWTSSNIIVFADGASYAAKWDGTTWTRLNGSGAPTNPKYVCEYRNHLVLAGYTSNPSAFTISAEDTDTDFTGASGAIEIVVGDPIVAIKTFREALYIFCRNSIYKLTGNSTSTYAVVPVTKNIGCIATDSVQEINADLIFLAPDGLRPVAATERIGDIEVATLSRPIASMVRNLAVTYANVDMSSTVINNKNQYRLFLCESSGTATDAFGIIGGLRPAPEGLQWEWGELRGFHVACADTDIIDTTETTVHGGYDGYVFKQETGNDLNGSNIYSQFRTAYFDFGQPTIRKSVRKMKLYIRPEGGYSITCGTILDYGTTSVVQPADITLSTSASLYALGDPTSLLGTLVLGFNVIPTVDKNLVGSAQTVGFNFVTNDTLASHSIQALVIDYAIYSRR